ncbi:uncharacterized protein LOC117563395 [Drosophila albomicans]|uniref:Uncharacterized protein LOC117563395 n=1 Tax=Drosophila albomicans TaxID=7291 RepID=A0A6P8WIY1_DROAB|nr:uncharacterized protein LOC117563395 [Drosophila albomicans]
MLFDCTCWLLLLLLLGQLSVCLGNRHLKPKHKHHVIIAHDGFHNIHHEPKYRHWKARQEQHAKHHNLISQTIINN